MAGWRRGMAGKVWYFDVRAAATQLDEAPTRAGCDQPPGVGRAAASRWRSAVTNGVARWWVSRKTR